MSPWQLHRLQEHEFRMITTIKRVNLKSLDELWKIERECFMKEAYTKQEIATLLNGSNVFGLGAWVNGEIAGFVIGGIEDSGSGVVGHIYTIDVAAKHRGQGVGAGLLSEIEAVFIRRNAEVSYLEVRADNRGARKLYEGQGYREIETLEDYYSSGAHGLRMRKYLRSR